MVILSNLNPHDDIKLAEKVPNLAYVYFKTLQSTVIRRLKKKKPIL